MPAPKTRKPNVKRAGKQEADVHAATEERLAKEGTKLTSSELESVEERLRLRAAIVYEIIRQEGEEELSRPASGLAWSGFSAGVTISFSLVAQALLHVHLPDVAWRPLVESLGYSVGFVLVIMARQQLFTENTITAVLPLLAQQSLKNLALTARLWSIVLLANLAGTFVFAALMWSGHFFDPPVNEGMRDVARHFVDLDWDGFLFRGIISGWLIAMLVWLLPVVETAALLVIVLVTYVMGLAGATHVIAGSTDAFLLALHGDIGWGRAILGMLFPTLVGNIIGGTALFSFLSYGQVKEEL